MVLARPLFQFPAPFFDQVGFVGGEAAVIVYAEVNIIDVRSQTDAASLHLQVVLHRVYEFVRNLRRLLLSRTYSRDLIHRSFQEGLDFQEWILARTHPVHPPAACKSCRACCASAAICAFNASMPAKRCSSRRRAIKSIVIRFS